MAINAKKMYVKFTYIRGARENASKASDPDERIPRSNGASAQAEPTQFRSKPRQDSAPPLLDRPTHAVPTQNSTE